MTNPNIPQDAQPTPPPAYPPSAQQANGGYGAGPGGYPPQGPGYSGYNFNDNTQGNSNNGHGGRTALIVVIVILVLLLIGGAIGFAAYVKYGDNEAEQDAGEDISIEANQSDEPDSKDDEDSDAAQPNREAPGKSQRNQSRTPSDITHSDTLAFQIANKNVGCEFKNGQLGCTVEITGQWDCGGGKASFALSRSSLIGQQCGQRYLGQPGDYVPMLSPGDRWTHGGVVCEVISNSRVSCINQNGDGFTVGDNMYRDTPQTRF